MRCRDMIRLEMRPSMWLAVSCLATVLCISGCDQGRSSTTSPATPSQKATGTNTATNGPDTPEENAPPVFPPPQFEQWPAPRAVLVFSGEQHGYVEPCGCSETQSGGLARRDDLVRQLTDKGWPVAGLDLGGTLKRARKQSELKFTFTHHALADMGYRALALGPEELHMGQDFLFTAFSEAAADERAETPFVSANVVVYGTRDLGTPLTHRVFELGDTKIAVTSVVGEKYIPGLVSDPTLLNVEPPAEALVAVVPQMLAESPDVMVLLSHAPPRETRALLEAFPQFSVAVTAEGPEDPRPDPELVGNVPILRVSQKGKHAGVFALFGGEDTGSDDDSAWRFELVNLDKDRFATSPRMVERMREYQQAVAAMDLASTEPSIRHPNGSGYVGAKECGKCHKKAYKIWSKSRHGHAFESLANGRPGLEDVWVNRQADPECLACHTTGWSPQDVLRFEGGFTTIDATPQLAAQGCENCHGPGKEHSELEWAFQQGADMSEAQQAARRAMHLEKNWAKDNLCVKCHDLDNSPKFDFDLYWPKVQHSGRD